jgi:putative ABC transport system permease protein
MVVVELALTLVLLVGAGLMVRSFLNLYTAESGMAVENLMSMRLGLPATKYPTAEKRMAFYDRLLPRLEALAGAEGVALATSVPGFGPPRQRIELEGRPVPPTWEERPEVGAVAVSDGFFRTTGIEIVRGRAFNATDGMPGSEAMIVDEQTVARVFGGEDPIGRRVRFPVRTPAADAKPPGWRIVVGISRTIEDLPEPGSTPSAGTIFVPHRQDPPGGGALMIRSRVDPAAMMNAVRREVALVDPDQPVFSVQTLGQMHAEATWPFRVFGSLFAAFALIALVLSAVGLYAVMAYSVTQRTPEIGVRMALGADRGQISWLVLRRGLVQLGIGLGLGLAGAYGVSQILTQVLAGISPTDPITFVTITALLTTVALAACLIPARRAARVDPLVALRD